MDKKHKIGRPPVAIDEAELRKQWEAGATTEHIADLLGVHRHTVVRRAHWLGLPPRPQPARPTGVPQETIARIREHSARGLPSRVGADEIGVHFTTYERYRVEFIGPLGPRRTTVSSRRLLTEADVDEIREELATTDRKRSDIAGDYGVSASTVSAIADGRLWAHLPNPHGPPRRRGKGVSAGGELLRTMWESGVPREDIAARLGCSVGSVVNGVVAMGLPRRCRRERPIDDARVAALYQTCSIEQIRSELRVSWSRVTESLHRSGVPVRQRWEHIVRRAR
jgi:hypothetical protein